MKNLIGYPGNCCFSKYKIFKKALLAQMLLGLFLLGTPTDSFGTNVPAITCAAGKAIECGEPVVFDAPTEDFDGCGGVVITFVDNSIPGCGNTETITRTWTATDDCGNQASCAQAINVDDSTPPSITCPPDQDIECVGELDVSFPANTGGFATCTDDCDPNPTVTWSDNRITGNCAGQFTIERTWTCTDECGNLSECVQTINVVDMPPSITCPPDQDIECIGGLDVSFPANTGGFATCTDDCDPNPTVTWSDNRITGNCASQFTIERTWTCTDECGNLSECVQTINVVDMPPSITCPPRPGYRMRRWA